MNRNIKDIQKSNPDSLLESWLADHKF